MVTRKATHSQSVIGYIRVSTAEQTESVQAQESRIKAYVEMRGIELSEMVVDVGVSGGTPVNEREGGARVLKALKLSKASGVVAVKLDRLFRSSADCLATVEAWDKAGIALHLVDMGGQTVDTGTSAGKLFLTMLSGFAEFERSIIGERTSAVLQAKKARGEVTGGSIPYGYRLANGGKVELDEAEQATIRRCVELDQAGLSLRKIAEALASEGKVTRKSNSFGAQQVQNILKAHYDK